MCLIEIQESVMVCLLVVEKVFYVSPSVRAGRSVSRRPCWRRPMKRVEPPTSTALMRWCGRCPRPSRRSPPRSRRTPLVFKRTRFFFWLIVGCAEHPEPKESRSTTRCLVATLVFLVFLVVQIAMALRFCVKLRCLATFAPWRFIPPPGSAGVFCRISRSSFASS